MLTAWGCIISEETYDMPMGHTQATQNNNSHSCGLVHSRIHLFLLSHFPNIGVYFSTLQLFNFSNLGVYFSTFLFSTFPFWFWTDPLFDFPDFVVLRFSTFLLFQFRCLLVLLFYFSFCFSTFPFGFWTC